MPGQKIELLCPFCSGNYIGNDSLDWYGDAVFGRFHCNDCGCTFAAKYILDGIVNGSVQTTGATLPTGVLPSRMNLGGQMVRHIIGHYENRW